MMRGHLHHGGISMLGRCSFCDEQLRAIWSDATEGRICQDCTVQAFELLVTTQPVEGIWDMLGDKSRLALSRQLQHDNRAAYARGFAKGVASQSELTGPAWLDREVADRDRDDDAMAERDTIPPEADEDTLTDNPIPEACNG